MWTEITRQDYECHCGRYASDMTDREWAFLAPFVPTRKTNGRPLGQRPRRRAISVLIPVSSINTILLICSEWAWSQT